MNDLIITLVIGIILIFIGIANMKGNISSLHSYHRHRVSEEDRIPFGKKTGLGTIIIGLAVIVSGILKTVASSTGNPGFNTAGDVIIAAGLIVGLGLSFYAMIKYNKGIF
jgi:uncharacterized membrane protein HdeD (DUF308 family)